jgi:D-glycero-beta-D-manno-heptose 1-phosphate adenylyltransferase
MSSKLETLRNKIVSLEEAIEQVTSWKNQGEKIVFTNGCFDILHQGHVVYLTKSADLGSKLVVALNTDRSVKAQNKGPERPINDESSRQLVLASLFAVDLLLLFDDETPIEIIQQLKPGVLVKGADYNPEEEDETMKTYIVGSKEVKSWGGEVKVIELENGFSTTSIVQKLKK